MKKLSVNDFERVCKANSNGNVNEVSFEVGNSKSVTINVKKVLSFKDRIQFVSEVVNNCFNDNGDFIPAIKNIAFKIAVLRYFTNFKLPQKNPSLTYNLLIHSEIYSHLISRISTNEIKELWSDINEAVEYRKDNAIATQKTELVKIAKVMTAMTEQYTNMFEGVDIKDFVNKLSAFKNDISKLGTDTATLNVVGGNNGV